VTTKKSECKTEVFARVTGFFRPVQEWNLGKQEEFEDRKKYSLGDLSHISKKTNHREENNEVS